MPCQMFMSCDISQLRVVHTAVHYFIGLPDPYTVHTPSSGTLPFLTSPLP